MEHEHDWVPDQAGMGRYRCGAENCHALGYRHGSGKIRPTISAAYGIWPATQDLTGGFGHSAATSFGELHYMKRGRRG